jgi:hypothetical protein
MKIAVLDVGKSNVKRVLVDMGTTCDTAECTKPNKDLSDGPSAL